MLNLKRSFWHSPTFAKPAEAIDLVAGPLNRERASDEDKPDRVLGHLD
jgi:hypothetical protein